MDAKHFTRAQWFALPLKLRQRWWRETDYGKREPSAELLETVGLRSRDDGTVIAVGGEPGANTGESQ